MKDVAEIIEASTGTNPGYHTTTEFTFKMAIER